MDITFIKNFISSQETSQEFKRLFHGRGGAYEGAKHLTIDSIDTVLFLSLYFLEDKEDALIAMLKEFVQDETSRYKTLVVQRRYLRNTPAEVVYGVLEDDVFAFEDGMKFKLNLHANQNIGFFADMKNGRAFVKQNAKDKNVLNLFSYTCSFSVAAKMGGAKSVVNVDMSKGALKVGMANHSINNLDPKGTSFLPYNILKSFGRLAKKGPYSLVIIDPPTFQKGSFAATSDYQKILQKLNQLTTDDATVVTCLNAPELDTNFLKELMSTYAPEFCFEQRVPNPPEFVNSNDEKALKVLIYKKNAV